MKIFTFYDFGRNISGKTTRWLGWLTFSLLLFMGQNSSAQCDITINLSSAGFGDEVSWELLDGDNTVVASGGIYSMGYNITETVPSTNPPYSLVITRSGTYCDNYLS